MAETSEIIKIPTLNGTENWMKFRKVFKDYCSKFPVIRGMIKEIKEPNWSERLQLLKTSFITMDVAEIWKTEEAEPSGATTRSKVAKEKSKAERIARKLSELERMQLKSAFDSQQDVADQPGLSVTAKDYKYSLLYGLTHDPSFSTYLQDYFSSKISQPVTYEDLERELTSWAITKDRLNAHNKPSSSRQEYIIPAIAICQTGQVFHLQVN